ncbi:MAG: TlpA family protein disulfide reductase [Caldilineales bacterium]|nr:TlpA family protein disulfide reductase [Caldilineales bacterium]
MSRRYLPIVIIAILVLGAGWIWLNRVPDSAATASVSSIPLSGHPAPDFELQTLDGESMSLADLRGKPVVLNFWASWCGPCRAEMPELEQAYRDNRDGGLVVLGVNQGEEQVIAADFVNRYNLTFPVVLDQRLLVSQLYRTNSLPTTFFIDRDGIIREQVIGQMNTAMLEQRLRSIYP